jgi:hypothetical protein
MQRRRATAEVQCSYFFIGNGWLIYAGGDFVPLRIMERTNHSSIAMAYRRDVSLVLTNPKGVNLPCPHVKPGAA